MVRLENDFNWIHGYQIPCNTLPYTSLHVITQCCFTRLIQVALIQDAWVLATFPQAGGGRILGPRGTSASNKRRLQSGPLPIATNKITASLSQGQLSGSPLLDVSTSIGRSPPLQSLLNDQPFSKRSFDITSVDAKSTVCHSFSHLEPHVQRRTAGLLRMHVVGCIRDHVEAGQLDYVNEIRPLTCLFMGFPSILDVSDKASHGDQLDCVQVIVSKIQEVMRK